MSFAMGRHPLRTLMMAVLACLVPLASHSAPSNLGMASTTTTISNTAYLAIPTAVGQPMEVRWTVSVNPPESGTPTGTVNVKLDSDLACSASVGTGRCVFQPQSAGTFMITAEYLGDANFAASTSAPVSHEVRGTSDVTPTAAITEFALLPPWPSPSRGLTYVAIDMPVSSRATLDVYDVEGRRVGVIVRDETMPAGRVTRRWDPSGLPAGVYILRARVGQWTARRLIVWLGN